MSAQTLSICGSCGSCAPLHIDLGAAAAGERERERELVRLLCSQCTAEAALCEGCGCARLQRAKSGSACPLCDYSTPTGGEETAAATGCVCVCVCVCVCGEKEERGKKRWRSAWSIFRISMEHKRL